MGRANAHAAPAAKPPPSTVCSALFIPDTPVNRPFTNPNPVSALSVATTDR